MGAEIDLTSKDWEEGLEIDWYETHGEIKYLSQGYSIVSLPKFYRSKYCEQTQADESVYYRSNYSHLILQRGVYPP